MDKKNILSVDMDYFCNATEEERIKLFPSCVEERKTINDAWANKYDYYYKDLLKIDIDDKKLRDLKEILKQQNKNTPIMIADSHVNLYFFALSLSSFPGGVHITNIDHHSDFYHYKHDISLNCGNWLYRLNAEKNTTFTWVANNDSEQFIWDGRNLKIIDPGEGSNIVFDFDTIQNTKFDAIFFCKSSGWYPPHLEDSFFDLANEIKKIGPVSIPNNSFDFDVLEKSFDIKKAAA